MKSKFILLMLLSFTTFANTSFKEATEHLVDSYDTSGGESWIRYTCHGPLTPKGITPIVHGDVVNFHFPVRAGQRYLSIREIQAQDHLRFDKIAKICAVRRFAQTDLTGFNGDWLDWDTAYYDVKIIKSEVVVTGSQCREVGTPCRRTSQCCTGNVIGYGRGTSGKRRLATTNISCNQYTNTCERGSSQEN